MWIPVICHRSWCGIDVFQKPFSLKAGLGRSYIICALQWRVNVYFCCLNFSSCDPFSYSLRRNLLLKFSTSLSSNMLTVWWRLIFFKKWDFILDYKSQKLMHSDIFISSSPVPDTDVQWRILLWKINEGAWPIR